MILLFLIANLLLIKPYSKCENKYDFLIVFCISVNLYFLLISGYYFSIQSLYSRPVKQTGLDLPLSQLS